MDVKWTEPCRARLLCYRSAMEIAQDERQRSGDRFQMGLRQGGSIAYESDYPKYSTG